MHLTLAQILQIRVNFVGREFPKRRYSLLEYPETEVHQEVVEMIPIMLLSLLNHLV